jgi:hypothetical protein
MPPFIFRTGCRYGETVYTRLSQPEMVPNCYRPLATHFTAHYVALTVAACAGAAWASPAVVYPKG